MTKTKVLCVTQGIHYCGGIESYAVNYFRNMNMDNIQIDFATHNIDPPNYQIEIERLGGNIFLFPSLRLKNIPLFVKKLDTFFRENHYDIIHCNMANAAIFYFYYAKKHNVHIRILHSHQSEYADVFSHKVRNMPLVALGKKYTTDYFACSKIAGDFLCKGKPYTLINNAIDVDAFVFNEAIRNQIRKQENLNGKWVIGHVGRFTEQKNHLFLIDIFNEIQKVRKDAVLMLIGDGHLLEPIQAKVKKYGIEDKVIFKGIITNVNMYLQAMDILVMPSLYEGLSVALVEAQTAGLYCFTSDTVSPNTKITDHLDFIGLKKSSHFWAEKIVNCKYQRGNDKKRITENGYNIVEEAHRVEKIYANLVKESRLKK